MGYRIDYQPITKLRRCEKRRSRIAAMTGAFLIFFFLAVHFFWPEGQSVIRSCFLPGDPEVTAQAMEKMIAELKNGSGLQDAAEVFCVEILSGAELDFD